MKMTPDQIKGRLKSLANKERADARNLLRSFMMERFLERLSVSKYRDNFIIKGGLLVTSMVGINMRSTMDIDASITGEELNESEATRIITEIAAIELNDGVSFEITDVQVIMDDLEYPGIRVSLNGNLERILVPVKIDISTGDAITPGAREYKYHLMLEDRNIEIWTYNLETMLAEKLQTILSRGILNTRMRDFYDIYVLKGSYEEKIDSAILKSAFEATCRKRGHQFGIDEISTIMEQIKNDEKMLQLWKMYSGKYSYASSIPFTETVRAANLLLQSFY